MSGPATTATRYARWKNGDPSEYQAAAISLLVRHFYPVTTEEGVRDFLKPVFDNQLGHGLYMALTPGGSPQQEALIGICVIYPVLYTRLDHYTLGGLCTDKAYRNRGIGERLVTFSLESLWQSRGKSDATIELRQGGLSKETLYLRCGFTTVYRDAITDRPVMVRRLSGKPLLP